jgi:hypothetical protein
MRRPSPALRTSQSRLTRTPEPRYRFGALRTVATDLSIAAAVEGNQLVHSHTWYANLAGHLAKLP